MPLNPVDTDARWRSSRTGKASGLQYQENVIVHLGGFILSRGVTHASERESKAVPDLLERLPLQPVSLAADTGYSEGSLRELLEERDIAAYIPIHTKQENSMASKGDFVYRGDHLICLQGKVLRRSTFHKWQRDYNTWRIRRIVRRVPSRTPVSHRGISNGTSALRCTILSTKGPGSGTGPQRTDRNDGGVRTIAEGTFASLDHLGWARSRLRGLWKVDCERVHGRAAAQRAENGPQTGPWYRSPWPSVARCRNCRGCRVRHGRRGLVLRRTTTVFFLAKSLSTIFLGLAP